MEYLRGHDEESVSKLVSYRGRDARIQSGLNIAVPPVPHLRWVGFHGLGFGIESMQGTSRASPVMGGVSRFRVWDLGLGVYRLLQYGFKVFAGKGGRGSGLFCVRRLRVHAFRV